MDEDAGVVTYFVRLREGEHMVSPSWVLRRVAGAGGPVDEVLGRDGEWHPSSMLADAERGALPGTVQQIRDILVPSLTRRMQKRYREAQRAVARQRAGDFTLRMPVVRTGTVERVPVDGEERADHAAFLTGAPLVGEGPEGAYRTDGMWVWPESIAETVLAVGLVPDALFQFHIRKRQFCYPEQVEPPVLERARQLLVVAATADGSEQVQEPNVPGRPPEPTRQQRMAALSEWHSEWVSKHEATTPFRPQDNTDVEDYNLHYVDLDASREAQREYDVRAREILGQDPETGRPVDI